MEAPRQRFNRLVGALEDLVTREAATLAEHDYEKVQEIQNSTAPLVAAIAGLGQDIRDDVARARVAGLLARRQHSIDVLESQLATARDELMAVQGSALRVAQIAPVYGRPTTHSRHSQFSAAV
jgi:predicted component of type VI protein secretion system